MSAVFFLAGLLGAVMAEQVTGVYNQMLDPGRITWWRTQWSPSPVSLSQSNAGAKGVLLTFYLTPTTSIAQGILEATCPGVMSTTQVALTCKAGENLAISLGPVDLPSMEGPYGPCAVVSRLSPSGQIIDANLNFAMVYVSEAVSPLASLAVNFANGASKTVRSSNNQIAFKMTLQKDLWRYDLFKITADSNFSINSLHMNCTSETIKRDDINTVNYYTGTVPGNPHALDCLASSKVQGQSQTIWVYGLKTPHILMDMMSDAKTIDLRVPGFINPDTDASSSQWTVEILRFGTTHILESLTKSFSLGISTASLASIAWKPTWGLNPSHLPSGLQIYTDLTFTLANPVPQDGFIKVNFRDETCSAVNYCFVTTTPALKCVPTDNNSILRLDPYTALEAKSTISVRFVVLLKASSGSSVVEVVTSASSGNIDKAVVSLSIASTAVVLGFPLTIKLQDHSGMLRNQAGGTGDSSQMIAFKLEALTNNLLTSSNVAIYCPFASAPDDFQIGLPASRKLEFKASGDLDFRISAEVGSDPTSNYGSKPTSRPAARSSLSPGFLGFSAGALQAGQNTLALGLSGDWITLPKVATNSATAYECRVEISDSTNTKPMLIAAAQFEVAPQSFGMLLFSAFCASVHNGAPVRVQFLPSVLDLPASTGSRAYFLELALPNSGFTTLIGAQLQEGDSYPVVSSLSTAIQMTVTAANSLNSPLTFSHVVSGMGLVPVAGSTVDIYFPVSGKPNTSPTITVQTFFTVGSDPRQLKYVIHSGVTPAYAQKTSASSLSASTVDLTMGSNLIVNGSTITSFTFTAKLAAAITGDTYFYLVFPAGYSFTSLRDVQSSTLTQSSFADKKFFSSPSAKFPFPGVLVRTTTSGAQISSSSDSFLSLSGLVAPLGVDPDAVLTFVHAANNGDMTQACSAYASKPLVASLGQIQRLQVSPSSIKAKGPGGVDLTQSVAFVLPHGIGAGGAITLTVSALWGFAANANCWTAGINRAQCVITGSSLAITGFDDFSQVTNTAVTVHIEHLLAPDQLGSLQFLSALKTSTASNRDIDVYTGNSFVFVETALPAASATIESASVFPPNAGMTASDLSLRFSVDVNLPANTQIAISVPYPIAGSDGKNICWVSPLAYSSCTLSAGLKITLKEAYQAHKPLEVFVLRAVTVPKDTTGKYLMKISAQWNGALLVQESSPGFALTPTNAILASIKGSISPDPRNIGEVASYNLTFTPSVTMGEDAYLQVQWPFEYDPYISDAQEMMLSEPGRYFANCTVQFHPIPCVVDHWTLILTGLELVAETPVSVVVGGVRNPASSSSFRLLILNSSQVVVEYGDFSSVSFLNPPNLIQMRSLSFQFDTNSYEMELYLKTLTDSSQLKVLFPPQFDIISDSFHCLGTLIDETNSTFPETTPFDSSCDMSNNALLLPLFNHSDPLSLLRLSIEGSSLPPFGMRREGQEPELWDGSVWGELRSWWTGKFDVFIYQADLKSHTARTYPQLNSAYLGFRKPLKRLWVNGYDPLTRSSRLIVYPGTQSEDFFITTDNCTTPVQVAEVKLTGKVNSRSPIPFLSLSLSSRGNFTLGNGACRLPFRISAARTLPKGLYMIEWEKTELKASLNVSSQYETLPNTLVEVPTFAPAKYTFEVAAVPAVPPGNTSLPIQVSISHPPHSDVTVKLSVTTGGSVSPQELLFESNVEQWFFSVTVDKQQQVSITVDLALMGTDREAYSILPKLVIPLAHERSHGSVIRVEISEITGTSARLAPITDRPGLFYYQVTVKGKPFPSFLDLRSQAALIPQAFLRTATLPAADQSWQDFQLQQYLKHINTFQLTGAVSMSNTAAEPITLEGLWAGTTYQVATYLDTLSESEPELVTAAFTTAPVPPCGKIELQFKGKVGSPKYDQSASALALQLNVAQIRLTNFTIYEHLVQRVLDTSGSTIVTTSIDYTSFYTVLLADRSAQGPDPLQLSNLSQQARDDLRDALPSGHELWGYVATEAQTRISPVWLQPVQVKSFTNTTVNLKLRTSRPGRVCCVAAGKANSDLLPEQVMLGFAADWSPAPQACHQSNLTNILREVVLQPLAADRNYYIYCAAEDDYPLWATQMDWSPQAPLPFIPLHTSDPLLPDLPEGGLLLALSIVLLEYF